MRLTILLLIQTLAITGLWAQRPGESSSGLWRDATEPALRANIQRTITPQRYRTLELQLEQLENLLRQAPWEDTPRQRLQSVVLELPLPEGGFERFTIHNEPVMHPALARQYPEIQTYAGYGIDDPTASVRLDLTVHGFHAQILSAGRTSIYIDPYVNGDLRHYISYYKRHLPSDEFGAAFCEVKEGHLPLTGRGPAGVAAGDCQGRTYRLAMACTGEYAAFFGGTVPQALAAMATSLNRVNGIFQNDFAITLQLIPNNNQLIFLNAATDNYTNGTVNTMATENQGIIDATIGSANYDIGHVLGTIGGGYSGVVLGGGQACNNGGKARGATTRAAPQGPIFDVDVLSHELGHQFSASHTFNEAALGSCGNAGQLIAGSAFEPGSGNTIMSYGGTCGGSDFVGVKNAYFHAISLQQVAAFVTGGGGSGCGVVTPLPNNQPAVNAGADFTIPTGTPFRLTATGNDPDGDLLTYAWEQMDNQLVTHPPAPTATNGPVFRGFPPTAARTRIVPQLANILAGTTPQWEVLPTVGRTATFRATVRDNAAGNGCTNEDDMVVTFANGTGPFTVSSPDSTSCYFAGDMITVNWNVAGSDMAPVSCANVDILLSTDGGLTFPTVLAANTPNDGSQAVTLPVLNTLQARIMVQCSDNIFFNISAGNFIIDCTPFLTVTDNPAAGTYKALDSLQTMGTVQVFGTARFFAGQAIMLNPGFRAFSGSDFLALIQPCDPCEVLPLAAASEPEEPARQYFRYEGLVIPEAPVIPQEQLFAGAQLKAFPNPFTQSFTLEFEMPETGSVQVQLIDVSGQTVKTVFQSDQLEAGPQQIRIDGQELPDGVYFCRVMAHGTVRQARLVKAGW